MKDKTQYQAELLYNRLVKRYRHLKKWARRIGTNAFRLYDRDIPEIPLVLDFYGDPTPSGTATDNDAIAGAYYEAEEDWLPLMKAAISRALDIGETHIFLRERQRMRQRQEKGNQYAKISEQGFYRDVVEGDLKFRVNLSDYLDTGLFLDSRKKRALIKSKAGGKRLLNLFAYTCSLSAAAAKGGAAQVDSVDLSNTYLDWGKLNFALNGFGPDPAGEKGGSKAYSFIRADVMEFLNEAAKERRAWDIIILDPPSFSNSKKMKGLLDIRRDHQRLIEDCLSILGPGGELWFSSNARGFRLREENFPGLNIKNMEKELADEDFRGKRSPACYIIKI